MSPLKDLQPEHFNLLNITTSEDLPYFFGLGMSCKYNCNYGFKESVGNDLAQKMDIRMKMKKSVAKTGSLKLSTTDKVPKDGA